MTSPLGVTPFAESVAAHIGSCDELPLVHTTLVDQLDAIVFSAELRPARCGVFHRDLIYLFYGRPAYRSRRSDDTTDMACCPVCFVFARGKVCNIHGIYPFDTGAARAGRYLPDIPWADVPAYALQTVIDSARQFTHMFFETNRNYYRSAPRPYPPQSRPGRPGSAPSNGCMTRGGWVGLTTGGRRSRSKSTNH